MQPVRSTIAMDLAGPLDHLPGVQNPRRVSHGHGRPHTPLQPLLLPPRRSPRYESRQTATERSTWELSLTVYAPSWRHADCTYKVRCP